MRIRYNGHQAVITEFDGLTEAMVESLVSRLSYTPTGSEFSIFNRKYIMVRGRKVYNKKYRENYDPRVKLFNRKTYTFPTGLLTEFMQVVHDHDADYKGIPLECDVATPAFKKQQQISTLRDYQAAICDTLVKYARGVAEAPTAAGKTVITSELCLRAAGLKILITVPTIDLLDQTVEEVAQFTGEEVGRFGDGVKDVRRITVATADSLDIGVSVTKKGEVEYENDKARMNLAWLKEIDYWIVDECHGAAAKTFQLISAQMPNTMRRHGLTATHRREDAAEIVLTGVLGPLRISIPPMELVEKGWLVRPEIEMHRLEHKTYREGKAKEKYEKVYQLAIIGNEKRMLYVRDQIKRCLDDGMGPVLVLFDRLEHGKLLLEMAKTLGRSALVNGKLPSSKRKAIKDKVKARELDIVVASVVWVTGVSINELQSLVVAGGGRSGIQVVQKAGRVLRMCEGKTWARIIDIWDIEESYLEEQGNDRRFHYATKYPGCVTEVNVDGIF
jgi:superfamily II DNA or RNA helicase